MTPLPYENQGLLVDVHIRKLQAFNAHSMKHLLTLVDMYEKGDGPKDVAMAMECIRITIRGATQAFMETE